MKTPFFNLIPLLMLTLFLQKASCQSEDVMAEDSLRINKFMAEIEKIDVDEVVKISLTDGSELIGKIIKKEKDQLTFKTLSGITMQIEFANISDIDTSRVEVVNGKYQRFDPNRTRLFFTPTGRALNAGEGYFAAYEIFFPMLTVGVTDWMSLSGGLSLLPGASEQLLYGNIKVTPVNIDDFSLSAGYLHLYVFGNSGGILYCASTYGNNDNSVTFGLGYGHGNGDFSNNPAFVLGGDVRLSNSLKLISENWFVYDNLLISFGLRFFGDNIAADFGLITSPELSWGFPFIPWLGFAYNFGR